MSTPQYGAALIGLVVGAILYGITLQQAHYYFHKYRRDPLVLKLCVVLLCLLDTLHLCFSVHMMYFYIVDNFGNVKAVAEIVWSLKGLGTVQVLVIWLVQCLYLLRIWKLSKKIITSTEIVSALLAGVVIAVIMAFGIGIMFIIKMFQLSKGLSPAGFRWAIFVGFGVTIVIDTFIAVVMSFLLYRSRSESGFKRTERILSTLIQYTVATGMLTSAASIVYIVLYVIKPDTLLYLAQEFSITRLYANSFLAMLNARSALREQMNEPMDIEVNLRFASPTSSLDESPKHYHTPPETHIESSLEGKIIRPPPHLGDTNLSYEDIPLQAPGLERKIPV